MNIVGLVGRLTKDPELRQTASGNQSISFTLAVNSSRKDQAGNYISDFIRCAAFGKTAELIGQYMSKGSLMGVSGSIKTGSYEKDGQKIYTTEVWVSNLTFCESSKARNASDGQKPAFYQNAAQSYGNSYQSGSQGHVNSYTQNTYQNPYRPDPSQDPYDAYDMQDDLPF